MCYRQLITFVTSESESGVVVGEPSSQIAMLTRVLREKEKEVKEFQHQLSDQTMSEVYVHIIALCLVPRLLLQLSSSALTNCRDVNTANSKRKHCVICSANSVVAHLLSVSCLMYRNQQK